MYLEPEIVGHLQQWKGKPGDGLAENDDFFDALISGITPVELFMVFSAVAPVIIPVFDIDAVNS